jgi:hypothetical protein
VWPEKKDWPNQQKWRLTIKEAIKKEFLAAAFNEYPDFTFSFPLTEGVLAAAFIECRAPILYPNKTLAIILPRLGIIHEEVERVYADLSGSSPVERFPINWTLSENFYVITGMSNRAESEINKDKGYGSILAEIHDLVTAMKAKGIDLWKPMFTLPAIISAMERKERGDCIWDCQVDYKLPIALALADRRAEANAIAKQAYAKFDKYQINNYASFYQAFKAWMS